MTERKKTVVVDFDGTIVTHKFPKIGDLQPGVIEALEKISKKFVIIISSCRNNTEFSNRRSYYQDMVKFLRENKIPHDGVDDGKNGKPFAEYYIDDRGIRYNDN